MTAPRTRTPAANPPARNEARNEVRLVGRVSQDPQERVLPSGDVVWTLRLVVPRAAGGRSRQTVDVIECAAWTPRAQRSVRAWGAGDLVEVAGALQRRFFRQGGASASRVEVAMTSGRVIRRAASG